MGRSIPAKQRQGRKRTSGGRGASKPRGKRKPGGGSEGFSGLLRNALFFLVEWGSLAIIGLFAVIFLLGHFGHRFTGTDLVSSLLPFGLGILVFTLAAATFLSGWKRLRLVLQRFSPLLPAITVLTFVIALLALFPRSEMQRAFSHYRTLVGGKAEAARIALAHQVYAAYRRLGTAPLVQMVERAQTYRSDIVAAAETYDIDVDLLYGLAATESSFLPRTSDDGGHGLFQITRVPDSVRQEVDSRFTTAARDVHSPRYNAFLGAATLHHYLKQMDDDLFLGLLAYNIGPANGGLRFIMEQYGATDFVTIQPYLLRLPRDYPIRVLSYGLAFRVARQEGRLLAYEEGENAMIIQQLGIPGL